MMTMFECELMDGIDAAAVDGGVSGERGVYELLGVGDYILEAELSLSRPVERRLRCGQQDDLRQALGLIEDAASRLPEGRLKNWGALLHNRASRCLREVSRAADCDPAAKGARYCCGHSRPGV